ncbi:endonuclease domain-containing 1 protein-like [Anabas testudineus]|uniref:endonuclease domain-containing 1 protein-like n=1 Tax=Anabas testudineus TaxID=64144 RepID=UPI000E460756|nr:endonuclease domain-containing 1 protein-like [Anabas testudineus]
MMTPLNIWCLLPLAVVLLSISPTETKVVDEMSECEGFLLNETPPQVTGILENGKIKNQDQNKEQGRYQIICQTFDNKERFVTLYDTTNKIPVFSAYKYRGEDKKVQRNDVWMIEPQLEDRNGSEYMTESIEDVYQHQASNNDYKDQEVYDRGHLFPWSYGFDESDKKSTCTLTNVVPQVKSFNQGSWSRMEQEVKKTMDDLCYNNNDKLEGYVVTGAQPSQGNKLKNRVNVPSMLWTALCCYSNKKKKWIAEAYLRDNVADKAKDERIDVKTLQELYDKLEPKLVVFPGSDCPLNEKVSDVCISRPEQPKSWFRQVLSFPSRAVTWLYCTVRGWVG